MKKLMLLVLFVICLNQPKIEVTLEREALIQARTIEDIEIEIEEAGDIASVNKLSVETNYLKIPEKIRVMYREDGGRIIVGNDFIKDFGLTKKAGGIFVLAYDEEKNPTYTIYVKDSMYTTTTVVHEIGHYVDCKTGYISESEEFEAIYTEEMSNFVDKYTPPEHNYDTALEYFAESFENCFVDAEGMQNVCPKTYDYIMEVVENI